jgi:predicted RNase H-like nuclease (RuvC/YqgF family)
MSSMAKIFVVVNLILAVAVFGAAATLLGAQDDYKKALEKATTDFAKFQSAKEADITRLNKELADQQGKASEALAAKNNAEGTLEGVRKENADLKSTNEKMNSSVETLSKEVSSLRDIIEADRASREKLSMEAKSSTTDKLNLQKKWEEEVRARASADSQIADLNETVQNMAAEKGDMDKDLRNTKFWLDKYRERYGDMVGGQGSAGRVLSVRGNLVVLSVGSQDKVAIGDVYSIRRGSTFVGQMKVTKVYKDQAVGEFDDRFTGPGQAPQAGDTAEPSSVR